jgi:glycosyltransferase involved in cell wall biosynthesis
MEESFGNTAVEAVLAARPLVVSDSSGLREAARGYSSAQAVDPGRTGDWADAVERVAADWARFRRDVTADAETARLRHAPERYEKRLVDVMASLSPAASGREDDARVARPAAAG